MSSSMARMWLTRHAQVGKDTRAQAFLAQLDNDPVFCCPASLAADACLCSQADSCKCDACR